jgi:CDP-2,3-bis-(O-geranylgeranyl)-sn-glycerol synthase
MEFLYALFLAMPAFVANMIPIPLARWKVFEFLNMPIDGGKKLRKKPIFGKNKTWRGLICGTLCGGIVGLMQFLLGSMTVLPFSLWEWILIGVLGGFGALFGDMIESFVKRQLGIKSGRPFVPFDQIDYILGFLLFTTPIVSWGISEAIFLLFFALIMNPIVNIVSYFLGIKKTFW